MPRHARAENRELANGDSPIVENKRRDSAVEGQTVYMADLHVHPDRLELKLTPAEKVLAFRRADVAIPRASIRSAIITENPWIWVRGIRAPGAAVPLTLAIGTWKFHGGKDFLLIKGSRVSVVIDLVGEEFARLVVSTNRATELLVALRSPPETKMESSGTFGPHSRAGHQFGRHAP